MYLKAILALLAAVFSPLAALADQNQPYPTIPDFSEMSDDALVGMIHRLQVDKKYIEPRIDRLEYRIKTTINAIQRSHAAAEKLCEESPFLMSDYAEMASRVSMLQEETRRFRVHNLELIKKFLLELDDAACAPWTSNGFVHNSSALASVSMSSFRYDHAVAAQIIDWASSTISNRHSANPMLESEVKLPSREIVDN